MPEFTQDFFTCNIDNFCKIRDQLGTVHDALEIGSYQGRSACWMLQNMISYQGSLTCIDPFTHQDLAPFSCQYAHDGNPDITARFWRNINEQKNPHQTVELLVSRSYPALADLISRRREFDFVYIDGNHRSPVVLIDACMSFGMLRPGGVMLFDDYLESGKTLLQGSKLAIDAFVNIFSEHIDIIMINLQFAVQKKYPST